MGSPRVRFGKALTPSEGLATPSRVTDRSVLTDLRTPHPLRIRRRKNGSRTVKVLEHTEARYDAQEVEIGVVYAWRPESVVVECDCGEGSALIASATACGGCGGDHEAVAREGLIAGRPGDEALQPWRYAGDRRRRVAVLRASFYPVRRGERRAARAECGRLVRVQESFG